MLLRFTKMHGCGNDFVVLDLVTQRFVLKPRHARLLADRRFGIGCDQVLVVEPPSRPDVDFNYRIFNADGSEVEQCGNGARCFARFVRDKRLTGKSVIRVETRAGIIELQVLPDRQVRVNMGAPIFEPARIPFLADTEGNADRDQGTYRLALDGSELEVSALSMGNPHVVTLVDDVQTAPVATVGPQLEHHPRFPQRVNAGFMQIVSRDEIHLRVHERGSGETLACGTGACAAAVAGMRRGLLERAVRVNLPGGSLLIEWAGEGQPVMMTGPAASVFEGEIPL